MERVIILFQRTLDRWQTFTSIDGMQGLDPPVGFQRHDIRIAACLGERQHGPHKAWTYERHVTGDQKDVRACGGSKSSVQATEWANRGKRILDNARFRRQWL